MLTNDAKVWKDVYKQHYCKEELTSMFTKRTNDKLFAQVGASQSGEPLESKTNCWLGWEILIESPYLTTRK